MYPEISWAGMEINEAYAIYFMLVLLNFSTNKIRSVWLVYALVY